MIDLDKLLELEAKATPGPYRLTDYKKLSACGKLVPYSLTDLELDVAMRNSIKELCTELKAAREVIKEARQIRTVRLMEYVCVEDGHDEFDALSASSRCSVAIKKYDEIAK